MKVELTEVLWLDDRQELSLAELAAQSGLSETELQELLDLGLLAPMNPVSPRRTIPSSCLNTARTARRLRDTFELDTSGLVLAISLLNRIQVLEEQFCALRAQMPHRTE